MKKLGIILVLLALLVGIGYFGWQKWGPGSKVSNEAKTNNSKYLVIKEWGVRFELPEELRGQVTYGLRKFTLRTTDDDDEGLSKGDKIEIASFEIRQLNSPPNNCTMFDEPDGSGKSGGVGVEIMKTDKKIDSQGAFSEINLVSDGRSWFHSVPTKASCSAEETQAESDLVLSLNDAINNSLELFSGQ